MGTRTAYVSLILAAAASFVVAAVILLTLPKVPGPTAATTAQPESAGAESADTATAGSGSSALRAGASRSRPSAGGWGLSYELSPEDRQSEYLAAFAMGTRIYDSLGPILVTSMILGLGQLGWALLGLLYAGLALGLPAAARWARRARPAALETAVHS